VEFEDRRTFVAYAELEGLVSEAENGRPSSSVLPSAGLIVPVVLSGGGGSRLWPFSTNETPKQFLPLVGSRSLFSEALERVRDRSRYSAPIVVGSVRHAELCERELQGEGEQARLILEPCARNTAAAIAMAAALVREEHGDDALMLVMPSDHVIEDVPAFHAAIRTGESAAREGRLVTFGIRPTHADTGYGYLQMGDELRTAAGVMEVERFVEKPPMNLAEEMVAGGKHLWNAGIFLFRAGTLMEELKAFAPAIAHASEQAVRTGTREGIRVVAALEALAECPSESIDYAVMEHSSRIAVVPMSPGWSDLGSWDALASLVGAATPGGPVTVLDCDNCFIRSDGVQVAALGVRDLIIVASGERLLVLPRGRSQEVKKLLSAMDSMAA
jgi:mannose-1-phosphate guanylyltransferase/mannose-1-phosphate guanylyltransferase/mannose-6-phosphate isomerase